MFRGFNTLTFTFFLRENSIHLASGTALHMIFKKSSYISTIQLNSSHPNHHSSTVWPSTHLTCGASQTGWSVKQRIIKALSHFFRISESTDTYWTPPGRKGLNKQEHSYGKLPKRRPAAFPQTWHFLILLQKQTKPHRMLKTCPSPSPLSL